MGNGSIQRKGRRLYLVVWCDGRQKWISLKTTEMRVARDRAKELLPSSELRGGERAWLEYLVRLGKDASARLSDCRHEEAQNWDSVLRTYLAKNGIDGDSGAAQPFGRWLDILKECVGGIAPDEIDARRAEEAALSLVGKYVSCRRMVGFYRRCWLTAGLDAAIWEFNGSVRRHVNELGNSREFYRRLTIEEVRRLYTHLSDNASDLADVVAIGFMTGLRLSDVAELDTSEISNDLGWLLITPNKTRRRKRAPLAIPLIHEASEAVARRAKSALPGGGGPGDDGEAPFGVNPANGGHFLFSPETRHRTSRRLCAAFAAVGLAKAGGARASFHSLRATFISMMDEAGVSPHITDAITGHGGGGMHARYTQPSAAALRSAVLSAIPPLG